MYLGAEKSVLMLFNLGNLSLWGMKNNNLLVRNLVAGLPGDGCAGSCQVPTQAATCCWQIFLCFAWLSAKSSGTRIIASFLSSLSVYLNWKCDKLYLRCDRRSKLEREEKKWQCRKWKWKKGKKRTSIELEEKPDYKMHGMNEVAKSQV